MSVFPIDVRSPAMGDHENIQSTLLVESDAPASSLFRLIYGFWQGEAFSFADLININECRVYIERGTTLVLQMVFNRKIQNSIGGRRKEEKEKSRKLPIFTSQSCSSPSDGKVSIKNHDFLCCLYRFLRRLTAEANEIRIRRARAFVRSRVMNIPQV